MYEHQRSRDVLCRSTRRHADGQATAAKPQQGPRQHGVRRFYCGVRGQQGPEHERLLRQQRRRAVTGQSAGRGTGRQRHSSQ